MIEIKNLDFSYGKKEIIHGAHLTFPDGTFTAIIGENGSGKTTLLKLACGALSPIAGSIYIDSAPITSFKKNMLAQRLSYFPQGRPIPDSTVLETVTLARFPYSNSAIVTPQKDIIVAKEALDQLGISEFAERRLSDLSYGERQKVYLAMMLAQNTKNRLFDEPTNYLDASSSIEMMRSLKKMSDEGHCIVAVIHDLSLALTFADKIVVIKDGAIYVCGTPEEIYENKIIQKVFSVNLEKLERNGENIYVTTP